MPTPLANMILATSTAPWCSVLIHPSHFTQARDELQAVGAMLVTHRFDDSHHFIGLVTPTGRGCLVGTSTTVPRRSVAHIADGASVKEVGERTVEALDRLAAGVDRLAEDRRRPVIIYPGGAGPNGTRPPHAG